MTDDGDRPAMPSVPTLEALHAMGVRPRRAVAILSLRPEVVAPVGLEGEVLVRIHAEEVEQFRVKPFAFIDRAVRGWNAAPESRVRSALHLLREIPGMAAGRAVSAIASRKRAKRSASGVVVDAEVGRLLADAAARSA